MYEAVALPKYKVHSLEIRAGAEAHTSAQYLGSYGGFTTGHLQIPAQAKNLPGPVPPS